MIWMGQRIQIAVSLSQNSQGQTNPLLIEIFSQTAVAFSGGGLHIDGATVPFPLKCCSIS